MVTADHQNPDPIPSMLLPPNCSALRLRSKSQTKRPTTKSTKSRPPRDLTKSQEKRLRIKPSQYRCSSVRTAMPRPVV